MNRHDEIKKLLEASRKLLSKSTISEENQIRKAYGLSLLREQNDDSDQDINSGDGTDVYRKDNVMQSIDQGIQNNTQDNGSDEYETKDNTTQKYQAYKISGGIIAIYGNDESELEITNAEKSAFQETMDEFRSEVSDLVDLNELNVYPNNVEWSGELISYKVKFTYSIGENGGIYVEGRMLKLDDEFMGILNKLKGYYEKFKAKWAAIISSRKETNISDGN